VLDGVTNRLNLRDLGGLPVSGGGTIRVGRVFRSAAPVELTVSELGAYAALKLSGIVDMRYDGERAAHPVNWRQLGATTYRTRGNEPAGGADFAAVLVDEAFDSAAAKEMMRSVYRRLPFDHLPTLADVFAQVLAGDGATLLHCTSGKDRTGMATALLLTALGTSREAIFADYLQSLQYDAFSSPSFRKIPDHRREALSPIFSVHEDYLTAMLSEIEHRSGSVDRFLAEALGISTVMKERLWKLLLQ
jgi:protein-tyrosine phosphatase